MLCSDCTAIDLPSASRGPRPWERISYVVSTEHNPDTGWIWTSVSSSRCELCRFFRDCCNAYNHSSEQSSINVPAWVIRLRRHYFKLDFAPSHPVLGMSISGPGAPDDDVPFSIEDAVCAKEQEAREGKLDAAIRLIPPYVDVTKRLKALFEKCRETHKEALCSTNTNRCISFATPIQVLDCESREIVLAPQNCEYTALSYTWGGYDQEASNTLDSSSRKSYRYPQTIEDAITVTRGLGLRYIWVDKYCINQSDATEKGHQIAQMHLVYRNAQITIIAAAGSNPSYGLAGISRGRHSSQVCATINGNIRLTSCPHDPWNQVSSSKWNERGWTYQEGYFSRRRLFFTDDQVIFDCMNGWTCEATAVEQQLRPRRTDFGFWHPGVSHDEIYERIMSYSERKLTFPHDVVNAFQGVFSAFETCTEGPLRHLWGVPFLPGEKALASFLHSLTWGVDAQGEFPVDWGQRRGSFPSWSWTGWHCTVSFSRKMERLCPYEVTVQVEMRNGPRVLTMGLEHASKFLNNSSYLLLSCIILEAWTIPVKLKLDFSLTMDIMSPPKFSPYYATAILGDGRYSAEINDDTLFMDEAHDPRLKVHCECKGVFLFDMPRDSSFVLPMLLIKQVDEHWERIGTIPEGPSPGSYGAENLNNSTSLQRKWGVRREVIRLG